VADQSFIQTMHLVNAESHEIIADPNRVSSQTKHWNRCALWL